MAKWTYQTEDERFNEFWNRSKTKFLIDYKPHRETFKNKTIKVMMECPTHGIFHQTPQAHLCSFTGCPECGKEYILKRIKESPKGKRTTEQFIQLSQSRHGIGEYNYSESNYISSRLKIKITHNKCGKSFWQISGNHLRGDGCPYCNGGVKYDNLDILFDKMRNIHSNIYEYDETSYKGYHKKIKIKCSIHGWFQQVASSHLFHKHGCPKCKSSKGELEITKFLTKNNIKFSHIKHIKGYGYPDFNLPDHNCFIEYDGEQHYVNNLYGSKDSLHIIQQRDLLKNLFCLKNGIKLIRIPYNIVYDADQLLFLIKLETKGVFNVYGPKHRGITPISLCSDGVIPS